MLVARTRLRLLTKCSQNFCKTIRSCSCILHKVKSHVHELACHIATSVSRCLEGSMLRLQASTPQPRPRSPPATRFQPFRLSSDNRAHAPQLTTEEIRMAELKARKAEEARQRRRVLHRMQTSPAVLPHASSPRRATKPKPFNLASVALHEHERAQREAQREVRLL